MGRLFAVDAFAELFELFPLPHGSLLADVNHFADRLAAELGDGIAVEVGVDVEVGAAAVLGVFLQVGPREYPVYDSPHAVAAEDGTPRQRSPEVVVGIVVVVDGKVDGDDDVCSHTPDHVYGQVVEHSTVDEVAVAHFHGFEQPGDGHTGSHGKG